MAGWWLIVGGLVGTVLLLSPQVHGEMKYEPVIIATAAIIAWPLFLALWAFSLGYRLFTGHWMTDSKGKDK